MLVCICRSIEDQRRLLRTFLEIATATHYNIISIPVGHNNIQKEICGRIAMLRLFGIISLVITKFQHAGLPFASTVPFLFSHYLSVTKLSPMTVLWQTRSSLSQSEIHCQNLEIVLLQRQEKKVRQQRQDNVIKTNDIMKRFYPFVFETLGLWSPRSKLEDTEDYEETSLQVCESSLLAPPF